MPHIVIKLYPGRDDEKKTLLADKVAASAAEVLECNDSAVSVAFEEVAKEDWPEKVYRPEILENTENLYKKPGYNPFE
ncbi:MAG: tautomerase family protein [Planctomycetota bacterium]|jgi:4-oxalocrotonate tautomerase